MKQKKSEQNIEEDDYPILVRIGDIEVRSPNHELNMKAVDKILNNKKVQRYLRDISTTRLVTTLVGDTLTYIT